MKIVIFLLLWMTIAKTQDINKECKLWRLPRNILPNHYEISLKLPNDSTTLTFRGSVKIDINCIQETDAIVLHSKFLSFVDESIILEPSSGSGKILRVVNLVQNKKYEMIRLKLNSNMTRGSSYVLKIPEFSGEIHVKDERGLFKTHESDGGITREAYCTFFQPTYARMMFPCFDEPNMKATFTVKVERPAHLKSYSNMPINKILPMPHSRFLDIFKKSPVMSTYLLAVSVNDFPIHQQNQSERTNIIVRNNKDDNLDIPATYAVAEDTLKEMEKYTNIPYRLEKLDHVIMNDYEFLGMEHWGLIIYRRKMFRQGVETAVGKQQMFSLIIHEIAHQWFGNLVTMDWWSYLWLNEAFSNYFQYVIGDKILPEWRFNDMFILVEFQSALEYDDQSKDEPTYPLTNKQICDVENNYGDLVGVVYRKGSTVIRMFQNIIGSEEHFKKALRIYLNNRIMSTAKPADLFDALNEVNSQFERSHLPENVSFAEVGETWTTQAGVPLVTVSRDYASGEVHLAQERFYQSSVGEKQKPEARWWIPLTWTTASAPEDQPQDGPQDWLYQNKTIKLKIDAKDWLLMNTNVSGYYRVNYDTENWSLLAEGLKSSRRKFPVANRVRILDDAVALVFAGRLDIEIAFNLTEFLMNEDDPIVWISAEKNLRKLLYSDQLVRYSFFSFYEKTIYIRRLMTRAYDIISDSYQPTGYKTPMHQAMKECLQKFACDLFVTSCYKDRYLRWMPLWAKIG